MKEKPKKRAFTNTERIYSFGDWVFDRESVMDCILESLVDEMISPKEHINETDILDIIRDAVDYNRPSSLIKSERIKLHEFTEKSINKCKNIKIPQK